MTERKAKRKLSDIDFSAVGSHVALVSKQQGHGANGHHYALVMKACNFSDEFVQKASQVKVQMEITEYLNRFYGLWYEDAEILARALGFTTKEMEEESKDTVENAALVQAGIEPEREDAWDIEYKDYITSKLQSIEVMKSLYDSDNIPDTLSKLQETEYLAMLQDQSLLEKAFKKIDKANNAPTKPKVKLVAPTELESVAAIVTDSDASTNVDVEKSVEPSGSDLHKETSMTIENTVEKTVEVIEKSQFDAIQKAFDEQKEQLTKALELVTKFEQEKKEAITKARKEKVQAAVKNAERAEVLFKAVGLVADEAEFEAVVKALTEMQAAVDTSELFVEKGAEVEEQNQTNSVAELLKARLSK